MKNSVLIIGLVLCTFIGGIIGFRTAKDFYKVMLPSEVTLTPVERPYNKELLLVQRNRDVKKGQFVYITGIYNEYLVVTKLETENFPPPETPIFVVHSFHSHFYMYIKSISK